MTGKRSENPNWKGGKTISAHGYVLVRVGTNHHLADIRGYAYEHRLIAEEKLGRRLMKGEMVHHINENKQDNHPDNLKIVGNAAEHLVFHRNSDSVLQLPNESNFLISCACGCEEQFFKYDYVGRPRKYRSGHNPRIAATRTEILSILEQGSMHRNRLAKLCEKPVSPIAAALTKMKKAGLVKQVRRGVWALKQ